MLRRTLIAATAALFCALPLAAQDLTNAQRNAAIEFVLNNSRHVLLHEIGHLFVDQFDLPVLGKEEDAVDIMATLIMLEDGGERDFAALADTVDGWLHSEDIRPTRGYVNADFYSAHSLDIQRSYTIACLMVGSDYERHSLFATRISLPIDRQQSCSEDYRDAASSWERLIAPHLRDGPPGAKVSALYRSHEGEYAGIAAILRQSRILEETADWLAKTVVLPEPVTIAAETCGEVNAFYVSEEREIILCYEWADHFFDLFVSEVMPVHEHFARMRELKLEKLGRPE